MIHVDVPQGSAAWFEARSGIPTASEFDKLLTPKTLKLSAQAIPYRNRLLAEWMTGLLFEQETTVWMSHGISSEEKAVEYYSLTTGRTVSECGLCLTDDRKVGASPDRFVGEDGLLEVKSPMAPTHVGYVLAGVVPVEYWLQVQGQLFVTQRKWLDFLSYYPGLPPLLVRVEPEQTYQDALAEVLYQFCIDLDYCKMKLEELRGNL